MSPVIWFIILILNIKSGYGLNASWTVPLFPEDSEENMNDYSYDDINGQHTSDDNESIQKTRFRINSMDVPCVNTTMSFCEDVTNEAYPTEYVEAVLAKVDSQAYENYFNKTTQLKVRLLSVHDDFCDSVNRLIYPKLAKNVQSDWRFVINQPSYQQPIHVEICQKTKSKCRVAFPNLVTSCVQSYEILPLLSIGEDGEIVSEYYEIPSSCKCQYKHKKLGAHRKPSI